MSFASRVDAFHEQAMAAAGGLADFGDKSYLDSLRLLATDLDRNTGLGELGEQIIAGNIVGDLIARLLDEQGYKSFPQMVEAPNDPS